MTLFDPYSHTRIHELRQDRLARKARRRQEIGLDDDAELAGLSSSAAVRSLLARITRTAKHSDSRAARRGAPALDS